MSRERWRSIRVEQVEVGQRVEFVALQVGEHGIRRPSVKATVTSIDADPQNGSITLHTDAEIECKRAWGSVIGVQVE